MRLVCNSWYSGIHHPLTQVEHLRKITFCVGETVLLADRLCPLCILYSERAMANRLWPLSFHRRSPSIDVLQPAPLSGRPTTAQASVPLVRETCGGCAMSIMSLSLVPVPDQRRRFINKPFSGRAAERCTSMCAACDRRERLRRCEVTNLFSS